MTEIEVEVAAAELESEVRCCYRLRVKERVRDDEIGGDSDRLRVVKIVRDGEIGGDSDRLRLEKGVVALG